MSSRRGCDDGADSLVGLRILGGQTFRDAGQLLLGRGHGLRAAEAPDDVDFMIAASVRRQQIGGVGGRDPEFQGRGVDVLGGALEAGRHDADDRVRFAIQLDAPIQDGGITAEPPLPERV